MPQLVWLSEHKLPLFVFAGVLLTASGVARYAGRHAPCPADPTKAKACRRLRRLSTGVFCLSLALYGTGFYFAFIAHPVMG